MDFSIIYRLKGLKPKNKDDANFYECCDLTKKKYLLYTKALHTPFSLLDDDEDDLNHSMSSGFFP